MNFLIKQNKKRKRKFPTSALFHVTKEWDSLTYVVSIRNPVKLKCSKLKSTEGLLLCKLQTQCYILLPSLISCIDTELLASLPKTQWTSYVLNKQIVIIR